MSRTISTLVAVGLTWVLGGCDPYTAWNDGGESQGAKVSEPPGSADLFTDISEIVGLPSPRHPLPDGTYFLPEIMGGGIALFDADSDGDLDLLQVRFPFPGKKQQSAPNRFFRQGSALDFVDDTAAARLGDPGYGQGVAVGDADSDGQPDVYVANYGNDGFFRGQGGGSFAEMTADAGIGGDEWSSSATFVDYDRDGDLDLYVVHYVKYFSGAVCRSPNGTDYCPPKKFKGSRDVLYRGDGFGGFADVTVDVGINVAARGLGVVCADLTRDGWVDIYVANDGEANQLWIGQGDGTFADEAVMRGVGFNGNGKPEGSMGVAIADVNGDSYLDLATTNLWNESNTLYIGDGDGVFIDESGSSGMAAVDLPYTGFGCGFFDYDHDGDLDFAVVNGRVQSWPPSANARTGFFWSHYAEPNLLFENRGGGRFAPAGTRAGWLSSDIIEVDRGLAFGDVDNDGDIDLAVGGLQRIKLLRNDAPLSDSRAISIRALTGNRDAIGAEVTVVTSQRRHSRLVAAGYSYASSSAARAHFGLGDETCESVEVLWPDGQYERFAGGAGARGLTVRQGQGDSL